MQFHPDPKFNSLLRPVEIFHVGRVSKHLQLDHLLRAYPTRTVVYVEDSDYHITNAATNLGGNEDYEKRLIIFRVRRQQLRRPDLELRSDFHSILDEAQAMIKAADSQTSIETLKAARADLIDRWKLFAEASHNEKKWMHERLNWLLVSQPILFTALTFSTQFSLTDCTKLPAQIQPHCEEWRVFMGWLPLVIACLGLIISCLVSVALLAAGTMHWKWTNGLNTLSSKLEETDRALGIPASVPTVPFGLPPRWPARTSSMIAPFIGVVFVGCWLVLVALLHDWKSAVAAISMTGLLTALLLGFATQADRASKPVD